MGCQGCYVGIITQHSNINKDVSFTARLSSALHVNCCCSQSQWGETGIIKLPDSIHLGGRDTETGRRRGGKKTQKQDICSLKPTHACFASPFFSFRSRESRVWRQLSHISRWIGIANATLNMEGIVGNIVLSLRWTNLSTAIQHVATTSFSGFIPEGNDATA